MPIRHFVVGAATAGFLISSAAVLADTAPGALDEIVVTASKRDEKLHDVAMSITAIGGDQLALRQLTGFADWAAQHFDALQIIGVDVGAEKRAVGLSPRHEERNVVHRRGDRRSHAADILSAQNQS